MNAAHYIARRHKGKGRALRFLIGIFILLCGALPADAVEGPALERGTAVTDPVALRELDRGRFAVGRMLWPARSADIPLTGGQLFALPAMVAVRRALDAEFDRYIARHKAHLPNESIGVGTSFDFQLFDRAQLYSQDSRFVLAGIVNRMDRAFVSPENCGEVRLIYRLTRTNAAPDGQGEGQGNGEGTISLRLPMTLNIVLKAKGDRAPGETCAGIARRWLDTAALPLTGEGLATTLLARDGPLDLIGYQNIDRIETNLQIAHAPKSAVRDFRTDYLLKVFRYSAPMQTFEEAPLENQIDRDRMLADETLRREFKSWLLDPGNFSELDRGTVLIPEKFLATSAIASTPVGFGWSESLPAFGLLRSDGATEDFAFRTSDVVAALSEAARRGVNLQNIRSRRGFERRLNDMSCSGCHQTRGIGGFHFPGVDWMTAKPSNAAVVPASPHFFGDQIRRRDILTALRDGVPPDYSRGFSSRPQPRGSTELAGTEYENGWGAPCYQPDPGAKGGGDRSFRGWTCADGLSCQVADRASRMGMCFVGTTR